ncbi:BTAD domain-containing putative transcriptional regulator [Streptomyces sp. NPDC092296]|uniref:AfsR/SARP family transcriptional regulator n=1 Tax=Streptomyces sp. NPDC092296 TaxID=3366012 RepID=UPI003818DC38
MEVQILGSLAVQSGDQLYRLPSKRVRTVLALLALTPGEPVGVDHLIDQLWPDRRMGNSRNALQANIGRLRRFLESITDSGTGRVVRTLSESYVLELPPEAVDSHLFLSLAERGAMEVGTSHEEAIALLEQALRLWRGPALFDLYDSPRLQLEAHHLDEQRLSVREDLIAAKLAVGRIRSVIPELRQLTQLHPGRERFSEQLMQALYRDGRQTEALDVFHRTRSWLVRELGLEPGHRLSGVYHSILTHDPVLDRQ